jgi:hypothetical protein
MPKLSRPTQPVLPKNVALQVADLAHVPAEEQEQFCDLLYGTVEIVWDWDRRALSSNPGQALLDAAESARAFHKQLGELSKDDHAWVEKLIAQTVPNKDTREWLERIGGRRVDLPW